MDLYSSLAQSVERMTVNHDVAGSSPAGGAKEKDHPNGWSFSLGFLQHPAGVKQRDLSVKVTARSAVTGNACRLLAMRM